LGITELEYSPINSDVVESDFGHLDLFIRPLHGTPIQGCIEGAHAPTRTVARATGTTGGGAVDGTVVKT
jgi:hypothetical protein